MVSEVESAHSKKWEVGSAELKPTGLGFARTSAKPPSLAPRSLRNLKRKRFHRRRAQIHCSLYVPDIICKSGGNTLKFYL